MFSNFSGNLSGMTGWIQENSKKAASSLQKSVTEISTGMSEMMAEPSGRFLMKSLGYGLTQMLTQILFQLKRGHLQEMVMNMKKILQKVSK